MPPSLARWFTREVSGVEVLKTLAWLLGFFLVAAGFGFQTPRQTFLRQDSAIAALNERQTRAEERNIMLLKLSCLDRQHTRRDFQLVGLRCDSLLNGPAIMQAGGVNP